MKYNKAVLAGGLGIAGVMAYIYYSRQPDYVPPQQTAQPADQTGSSGFFYLPGSGASTSTGTSTASDLLGTKTIGDFDLQSTYGAALGIFSKFFDAQQSLIDSRATAVNSLAQLDADTALALANIRSADTTHAVDVAAALTGIALQNQYDLATHQTDLGAQLAGQELTGNLALANTIVNNDFTLAGRGLDILEQQTITQGTMGITEALAASGLSGRQISIAFNTGAISSIAGSNWEPGVQNQVQASIEQIILGHNQGILPDYVARDQGTRLGNVSIAAATGGNVTQAAGDNTLTPMDRRDEGRRLLAEQDNIIAAANAEISRLKGMKPPPANRSSLVSSERSKITAAQRQIRLIKKNYGLS